VPTRLESEERTLQAAAVPYRWRAGRLEIALVTRRQGKHWILPKGHVEPGETPRQSALREAAEEAGLIGRIGRRPLGTYEYVKGGEPRLVQVFVLQVTRQLARWSEDDVRTRTWLRPEQAMARVREGEVRQLLRLLVARLPGPPARS